MNNLRTKKSENYRTLLICIFKDKITEIFLTSLDKMFQSLAAWELK